MIPNKKKITPGNARLVTSAKQVNCWLQIGKDWYTPDEYIEKLGPAYMVDTMEVKIRNPLAAAREACEVIAGMIDKKMSAEAISAAISKLNDFVGKIASAGYKPLPKQLDNVML